MKARLYILSLVALACVAFFAWKNVERWRYGTFDTAKWSQMSVKGKQNHRYFMAQDIVTSASLMGKTSAEVRSLLGSPDKDIAGSYLLYNLGPNRGSIIKVDDDWLEIQLNEAGYVENAKIRPD